MIDKNFNLENRYVAFFFYLLAIIYVNSVLCCLFLLISGRTTFSNMLESYYKYSAVAGLGTAGFTNIEVYIVWSVFVFNFINAILSLVTVSVCILAITGVDMSFCTDLLKSKTKKKPQ